MRHELWEDPDNGVYHLFCLAGPRGDEARSELTDDARLVWTVEASSHFEAMTKFYAHMGWGRYTTHHPEWDLKTYAEHGWE